MKRARRLQWAEALTSGDYEQGRGQLRIKSKGRTTYCCLGVLHDLAVKDGAAEWSSNGLDIDDFGFLTHDAMDWAGISPNAARDEEDPVLVGDITATQANDKLHWSFAQIADALTGKLKLTTKQAAVLERIAGAGEGYLTYEEADAATRRVCANLVRKGLLEVTDPPGWKIP